MLRSDDNTVGLVLEVWREIREIDVARIVAIEGRLLGIEGIDVLKMRGRGVEPLAIEDQVPIVGELNPVTTAGHHALNVELVLRQALNALCFEHDNLAALRREKVIREIG